MCCRSSRSTRGRRQRRRHLVQGITFSVGEFKKAHTHTHYNTLAPDLSDFFSIDFISCCQLRILFSFLFPDGTSVITMTQEQREAAANAVGISRKDPRVRSSVARTLFALAKRGQIGQIGRVFHCEVDDSLE